MGHKEHRYRRDVWTCDNCGAERDTGIVTYEIPENPTMDADTVDVRAAHENVTQGWYSARVDVRTASGTTETEIHPVVIPDASLRIGNTGSILCPQCSVLFKRILEDLEVAAKFLKNMGRGDS